MKAGKVKCPVCMKEVKVKEGFAIYECYGNEHSFYYKRRIGYQVEVEDLRRKKKKKS